MKKNKIYTRLIILFLTLSFQVNAQTWQNITYSNTGLSSNRVKSVFSDASGNFWIATSDSGMALLKSGQFRNWRAMDRIGDNLTENGPNSNGYISRMLKDSIGCLFFGGGPGLLKFDSVFKFIKSPFGFSIYPLAIDKKNNIWCRTASNTGNGIVKYTPNGVWQNYTKANSGLNSNEITDISIDKFGNIWIGYWLSSVLTKYDGINWKSYGTGISITNSLKSDANGNVYQHVASSLMKYDVLLDSTLNVLTSGSSVGIDEFGIDLNNTVWTTGYDNLTQSVILYKNAISPNRIPITLSGINMDVNSIFFENNDKLWLTASFMVSGNEGVPSNKGLAFINFTQNNLTLYTKENSGLLSNRTNQVISGRKANELIVAHNDGISFLDIQSLTSKVYNEYNTGLYYDNLITDVYLDSRGNKWISNSGFVQKLGPDNKTWEYYAEDSLLFNFYKLKKREDKYGNIWFYNLEGVSKISPSGIITNISGGAGGYLRSMAIHPNGDVWVIQGLNTIKKYDGTTWSTISHPFNLYLAGSNLEIDKNGKVWFTSSISYELDGKYYRTILGFKNNIWDSLNTEIDINTNIESLYSDKDGKLWLILQNFGAACYDGKQWTRYNINSSNILSNNINDIHVDALGKVFFSTDKGISILTPGTSTALLNYIENREIQVYPNPTREFLNIDFGKIKLQSDSKIQIHDMLGRLVYEEYLNSKAIKESLIPLAGLLKGNYILTVIIGDKLEHIKFIKE